MSGGKNLNSDFDFREEPQTKLTVRLQHRHNIISHTCCGEHVSKMGAASSALLLLI